GLLYGPEFAGQRLLVAVLGLGLVVEAVGIAADSGLWAIERPRVGFWIGLVALAVLGLTGWWLVPAYGAVGAAAALAAASGAAAALQLVAFLRLSRETPEV
ncbi:MAG: polysaccharide biosynthesis C-terminal domain-containing protein, partial [Bacteroidota bacterium]